MLQRISWPDACGYPKLRLVTPPLGAANGMVMETTVTLGVIYLSFRCKKKGFMLRAFFLNLDCLCSGVPVSEEIMLGRARVDVRGSYRGHLGLNPQGELDFAGMTWTTAKSRVREGGKLKIITPHQERQRQQSRGCVRGTRYQQQPPQPRQTETSGRISWRCAKGTR